MDVTVPSVTVLHRDTAPHLSTTTHALVSPQDLKRVKTFLPSHLKKEAGAASPTPSATSPAAGATAAGSPPQQAGLTLGASFPVSPAKSPAGYRSESLTDSGPDACTHCQQCRFASLKLLGPFFVCVRSCLNGCNGRVVCQRRLLHVGASPSGLAEGRRLIKEAVGATNSGASPFSETQSFNRYGGADIVHEVMKLRERAMMDTSRTGSELSTGSSGNIGVPWRSMMD